MRQAIERVMVYLDGSEESLTATQYAISLCRTLNATLCGIYIVNTHALNDLVRSHIFIPSEQEEYQRDLEEDAEKYLRHFEEIALKAGVSASTVKESGRVHIKVKEQVRSLNIDLLIIGELSRIRSRRDEFYNESERAMRTVPCSVLIVKDEERVIDIYDEFTRGGAR